MVVFKKFDMTSAESHDWNKFHEFRRKSQLEDEPDDPIVSNDAFERNIKGQIENMDMEVFTYEIFDSDEIIGKIFFAFFKESSPSFQSNEKIVMYEFELLNKYRNNDIENSALKLMSETCEKYDKSIFICNSHNPQTINFFLTIGAKIAQRQVENRLKLAEIDWVMIGNWIEEGKRVNKETYIETVVGEIPSNYVFQFIKVYNECASLQPRDNLQMGNTIMTVEQLTNNEETEKLAGITTLTTLSIEKNKEISGFTILKLFPGQEKILTQSLTGVPLRFRERKLGKWVKAKMLLYVKENYPSSKSIVTTNAESNAAMLYINNKLGFKRYKETVISQITLQEIKNYLDKLKIDEFLILN